MTWARLIPPGGSIMEPSKADKHRMSDGQMYGADQLEKEAQPQTTEETP